MKARRSAPRAAVGAVSTLILLALVGPLASPTAMATGAPSSGALGHLADCSAKTGRLDVLFLVDESASLRRTDPNAQRVQAVQTALTGLAQLSDRTAGSETPVKVD